MDELKRETSKKHLHLVLVGFVRISLIFAFFEAIRVLDFFTLFIITSTFILTLSSIFFKRKNIKIPQELESIIVLFVYAALFLGEVREYYLIYWWWDILLHFVSAIALGFVGLSILHSLDKKGQIDAKPFVLVFFAFCFVLAIGSIWEIFEFGMDKLFGFNMQKSGLVDTMGDFIVDALGGLIASIVGYWYIKKERSKRDLKKL